MKSHGRVPASREQAEFDVRVDAGVVSAHSESSSLNDVHVQWAVVRVKTQL